MRLPKRVKINGIPFDVVKDPKTMGGKFSYDDTKIEIGTKKLADCEVLENFLHEVAEISMVERGMRSARCKPTAEATEFVFSGNHRMFSDVVTDVSNIVSDLMRLK
ncbi:hypothetical protein LCGC14_1918270 [marine sediment metagenome]|uniref:Uncharacterized protein n=1 Tax=marine sediment metagenome TaxID=412755 RepID=A0A0F9FSB0_9ZZZZ